MGTSSVMIDKAHELAAAGRHAEVIEYLTPCEESELGESPDLALLFGTAHAQLGRDQEGVRWLTVALDQARRQGERGIERRALNARGAAALVAGRIDEAADYVMRALMLASLDNDLAMVGRCSNNLAIISHLRGRCAEAIGQWEIAAAAFEQAGLRQGVAECYHNLGIAYREQGALERALAKANRAVAEAQMAEDLTLLALALRGRAEVWVRDGKLGFARRDLDQVRQIRGRAPHPVDEAEDLRVEAVIQAAENRLADAEQTLREVIRRAQAHGRPQLLAEATRDLATVLRRAGRPTEAQPAVRPIAAELRESLEPIRHAQALADAGRYVDLLAYLAERSQAQVERSPTLALLCGIAHSRLGRPDAAHRWATTALARAQALDDRSVEIRALSLCGSVALERGGICEATRFFARAQEEALRRHDMATVGWCANRLGVAANLQGDHGPAVGAHTRALAAYQKDRDRRGIAESQHHLGVTYLEQRRLDDALDAADAAVREAQRLEDRHLAARALAGRAEIRIARAELTLAVLDAKRALAMRRELGGTLEPEDLRVLAIVEGDLESLERRGAA